MWQCEMVITGVQKCDQCQRSANKTAWHIQSNTKLSAVLEQPHVYGLNQSQVHIATTWKATVVQISFSVTIELTLNGFRADAAQDPAAVPHCPHSASLLCLAGGRRPVVVGLYSWLLLVCVCGKLEALYSGAKSHEGQLTCHSESLAKLMKGRCRLHP